MFGKIVGRRSFLSLLAGCLPLAVAPALAASAPALGPVTRISNEEDDPGYRAYCIMVGDDKRPQVFLDGVEQKFATMADSAAGLVKRCVMTPDGDIAHDGHMVLMETVRGKVTITIRAQPQYATWDNGKLRTNRAR